MDALSKRMPRLEAKAWSVDHAEALHELYRDGDVTRMLHFEPNTTLAQTRSYIAERVERFRALPPGLGAWTLFERAGGELVGALFLKPLADGKIEIGWHLKRSAWGKGYASEAGRAGIRYGFETLGLNEIYAITLPENARSGAVCQRCGMTHLGRTKNYHDLELEFYRIRASDVQPE